MKIFICQHNIAFLHYYYYYYHCTTTIAGEDLLSGNITPQVACR